MDIPLKRCPQCKGPGILRYRKPYHWVECKYCGYRTVKCCDYYEENDPESIATACNYWNNYGRAKE